MKICLISKYPPIEGGESSKAYWLAKALGERGHEVHVVTNAWEVESAYREHMNATDLDFAYQPKNVHIHNTDPFVEPSYIPYARPYVSKLASLAIDVIREYDLQLIDSWYVLPYVISGFLAKSITNRPQIMRHAGSDMCRLLDSPYLRTLFLSIFENVDKIVTYPSGKENFLRVGIPESRIFLNTKVSVNTQAFNSRVEPIDLVKYIDKNIDNIPIITYIGKLERAKGIYELIEAASRIEEDFFLLFVSKGKGTEHFKKAVDEKGLRNKTIFLGFLPPWRIPSVIKKSTCVVIPERDFPVIQHTPILPREVMAVGKCLILSKELYSKRCSSKMEDGKNVIVVDPKDISQFRNALEKVIKEPSYSEEIGRRAWIISEQIEKFGDYINNTIDLYKEILELQTKKTI